jgi:hypothetical protein
MVVSARDLPEARRRRWAVHAVLVLLVLVTAWWGLKGYLETRGLRQDLQRAADRLVGQVSTADAVAADCGLEPFSDEEALKVFPVELPPFPTRAQVECAERVTTARADLIETHLRISRLGFRVEEVRQAPRIYLPLSGVLALALGIWLYASELRYRRP